MLLCARCFQAVKCPSVGYQLAGTKKIQQVLTEIGQLEKFLEEQDCTLLRQCFAGTYCPMVIVVR